MSTSVLHAEEAVPSQHGLSDQMEEAAKEWFSAGPHDKVNFEVNLMVAPGPLGEPLSRIQHACCLACLTKVEIETSLQRRSVQACLPRQHLCHTHLARVLKCVIVVFVINVIIVIMSGMHELC